MILMGALALMGCGDPHRPIPVSGLVTLDGNPVEGATLSFFAIDSAKEGRPAQGVTNGQGLFFMTTMTDGDGVIPGTYKVVINRYRPTVLKVETPAFPEGIGGEEAKQDFYYEHFESKGLAPFTNVLPPQYASMQETPFTITVTKRDHLVFDLTTPTTPTEE
jgi:hypothetical protein